MNTAAATNRTPHYICPPELLPEPCLIPGEEPAVWDKFRAQLLATLNPGSFIEHELAERIALQMWRFRRASRYEADVGTDEFESARTLSIVNTGYLEPDEPVSKALLQLVQEIEEQTIALAQMQAARELLRQLPNLTNATPLDPHQVATLTALVGVHDAKQIPTPQTAGVVRRALADWSRRSIPEALKWASGLADEKCKSMAERLAGLDARRKMLLEDMRQVIEARQRDRTLLPRPALERALRYKSHVGRQLTQAMTLLKEFRAERLAQAEDSLRKCDPSPPQLPTEDDESRGATTAPGAAPAASSFRNFDDAPPTASESESSFGNFAGRPRSAHSECAVPVSAAAEAKFAPRFPEAIATAANAPCCPPVDL